ncbi:phytochelatin synthase family protein [Methylobacterium nigriterrae]|uniref:phytochelatin synthase family protein n=1 Tax=Methylobacterium nigriterrae TaxID=3127512 RepID=UPI003013487A
MRRIILVASGACLGLVGALALTPGDIPQGAIDASVVRSGATFERAWRLPVAARFPREIAWQSNLSRCGPASLANVFRSLGEGAASEGSVLAGTGRCRTGFCIAGLTLDELADLARTHAGRRVTVLRDLGPEAFQAHLRRANDPDRRYIVNFSRRPIFGSGAGHHSPIGGYLEEEDLVLVLDTNRAVRPWLIERGRLFSAMDTLDGGRKRGLLLIE